MKDEKKKDLREDQMVVITDDGTELVCDIIFTHEANGKNYVVFAFPDDDEVSAAIYVPSEDGADGEFFDIETDEEWQMLDELLEAYYDDLDALDE